MTRWSVLWAPLLGAALLAGCLDDEPGDDRPRVGDEDAQVGGDSGPLPDAGPDPEACTRTFVYRHVGAPPASVRLAGAFEGWQGGVELADADGDGFWQADVPLVPGEHTYKYIVDGNWIHDPDNPRRADDSQGGFNSLLSHDCPFAPDCLTDAHCAEAAPLCRFHACVGEEPCNCPAPQVCGEGGACTDPPVVECDEANPCAAPLVCRDHRCEPECLGDGDCPEGQLCRELACFEPQCLTDAECDALDESCDAGLCVPRPCNEPLFTFDAMGEAVDAVYLTGTFTDWAESPAAGAIELAPHPERGLWYARVPLENGRHSYKYILVRGGEVLRWTRDPGNPATEDDGFGDFNSVLELSCEGAPGACGDPDVFDWRDAVMYFALVDRFYDADGRADPVQGASGGDAARGPSGQYEGGDLRGMTAKIPYLRDLGVTALWLSAPYENRDARGAAIDPNADQHYYSGYHGYWPSPADIDFSDPDDPRPTPAVESRIGTAADLREMIDAAHGEGMKVLFDYVMNHVDIDSGLYRAHPDWFARRDGRFALCGPENLWDDAFWGTRCAFTDYLPPFDFDNAAARAWSVNDALWWARAFGIDGYRLDAIKHVPLQWLIDLRARLNEAFPEPDGGRFYLVGETFAYDDAGLIRQFVNPETMLDGQFDFPFKARLCEALFTPNGNLRTFSDWLAGNDGFYGPGALMTTWIGNHDIPRAIHFASRQIGDCRQGSHPGNGWTGDYPQPNGAEAYERLGLSFVVMMTNPGIPLIYYGDEIGLAGGGDPDNRRLMPWDDGALSPAQRALRDRIAALGRVRAENKVLARGRRLTLTADQNTWVYRMTGCGGDLPDVTVAINRADQANPVRIPDGQYVDLMTGEPAAGGPRELPPRGFLLLRAAR